MRYGAGPWQFLILRSWWMRNKFSFCEGIIHEDMEMISSLVLFLDKFASVDEPLYIYGPPKIAEYIETSRKVLDMYINYPIVVKEITAPCIVHQGEDFYVRCFPLDHTKTCVGYTLEELDRPGEFNPAKAAELGVPMGPMWGKLQKGFSVETPDGRTVLPSDVMGEKRSGRKFSFVTDTLYKPSIAEEVRGSDLLVCEGMFEDELIDQAKEKKHMTASQAATVARDSNSKRMCLIHYSPRYTDKELPKLLEQARKIYPEAELSKDRMHIEIPYVD